MKSIIIVSLLFFSSLPSISQEDSEMFCFASIIDLNGVTLISEIYVISSLEKEADKNSFKLINSNSFQKVIISMGHQFSVNKKTKGVNNLMIISKDWKEITRFYDDIKMKSNGKIIVIDKEAFSIQYPSKKEVLIRE